MTDAPWPVVNARMYAAAPAAKRRGRMLARVLEQAELAWEVIDYDAPAPLSALWARDDLGVAMMCGLPFSAQSAADAGRRAGALARALPRPPVYFTDIVVSADSPSRTLEDTFGGVVGYTVADSMSGGRRCAGTCAVSQRRPPLYKAWSGTDQRPAVIEALAAGASTSVRSTATTTTC